MRNLLPLAIAACFFYSCGQQADRPVANTETATTNTQDFFPVTNFIQGEIVDIRGNGVNPLKITTSGTRIDSAWLKVEELDQAFAEFLTPVIDSSTMGPHFKETKFLDQSINAYTFTYEPKETLPDNISVQRWDVYINPQTNTVKRIYIEKLNAQKKQLRMTWQSKEWCRIVVFSGRDSVEREDLIKWKFE